MDLIPPVPSGDYGVVAYPQGAATRGHDRLRLARRSSRLWPARRSDRLRPARKGQRPATQPAEATTPVAGVVAPWQGGCRQQRATVTCAGAAAVQ
ncbi:hypothetical protein GW17_00023707 [Ensete ventricosum]|nr:hypothetical protein GW17_00023707 [Ensete ventricosum]